MSIGFASNYTRLHFITDDKGNNLYLGQGISTIEADNEDETDDTAYYNSGGAQPNDVIGTKIASTVSGHRFYGDPAQDYIGSLETEIGDKRVTTYTRIAPDGSKLVGPATITDIVNGGGDANDKGTFECALTYREMPTFIPASSKNMPTGIKFAEQIEVKAGETLDLTTKITVEPSDATPNCVFALDDDSLDLEGDGGTASLDDAGILTGIKEGTVKVTAKCISKPSITATTEVTVKSAEG